MPFEKCGRNGRVEKLPLATITVKTRIINLQARIINGHLIWGEGRLTWSRIFPYLRESSPRMSMNCTGEE